LLPAAARVPVKGPDVTSRPQLQRILHLVHAVKLS
jgi:hypothetical protein